MPIDRLLLSTLGGDLFFLPSVSFPHKWVFVSLMHAHILGNASLARSLTRSKRRRPLSFLTPACGQSGARTDGRNGLSLRQQINKMCFITVAVGAERTNAASSAIRRTGSDFDDDSANWGTQTVTLGAFDFEVPAMALIHLHTHPVIDGSCLTPCVGLSPACLPACLAASYLFSRLISVGSDGQRVM